jgi:mono/diheme cytochrome c family protein
MSVNKRVPMFVLAACTAAALVACVHVDAADYQRGAELYAEHCEGCHGPNGQGLGGMGELRPWEELLQTDEDLFAVIRDGDLSMPGYDGMLTGEEILDIIAYMRTFQ